MKVKCKNCQYEREHLGEDEDYQCPICGSILNEDKEVSLTDNDLCKGHSLENETISLDEVIRLHIIASFKRDIEKIGKERVWKVIEHLVPAKVRIRYRKFYFLALKELEEKENEINKT